MINTRRIRGGTMSNETAARAARVASTIGVFKWIMILIVLLAGVITLALTFANGESSAVGIGLAAAVGAVLYALMIWVLFGWFELTLRALAAITTNTTPTGVYGRHQ
jgi:hypothetical protein